MAYEYLNDIFGEFRINHKTRFTEVEQDCIKWMTLLIEQKVSNKEFAENFWNINEK